MEGSVDAAPLVPGQVLENKYRVSKALGGGAMGIVYDAYHLLLQKSVAIKVLRPELAAIEDLRDRFEAEARAAAAIGHPNIITVTDMGQTPDGALYFVMDRLRGETLGDRLDKQGKLDVAAAGRIALEVLSGLEAAHELRLVHRDLKPDNIFLARPPGGREIAKILDFGIAKALASVGRRNMGTRVGATVGTPMYMAPEQAVGDPDIDARADLYSLAVILYQVLAGRPPFDGKDAVSVLAAMMTETPASLQALCPAAPFALVQLVEAGMSRDRERRPASAAEFTSRLQEALAGIRPDPAPGQTAYDVTGLAALDSAVLVDLAGDAIPDLAAAALPAPADEAVFAHEEEDHPATEHPTVRETYVIPVEERPAALAAPAPRKSGRRWLWLAPLPALALGAVLLASRPSANRSAEPIAAANRATALVEFDVPGQGRQLFLDGSPLASNPIALGEGEFHTVTAVTDGRVVGIEKFKVDQPRKTVRVRVGHR
jgi:tRNA A-37 threonylcarbamoyl transferase component Bud32